MKIALKVLLAGVLALSAGAAAAEKTVKIGWTAWSDAEFVTKLAKRILEDRMGYEVELLQTDIAPQYQGLATGSLDLMLMSWQPGTHADYIEKVGNDVVPLGILYTNARLGWAVPDYVPEETVSSIPDLNKPEVTEKLDETITGIDPGAGLTRLSKQAIEDYGLDDYELQISSGAGMTAALERAIRRDDWIVVTAWSPHWMFGAYDLRYLDDPKLRARRRAGPQGLLPGRYRRRELHLADADPDRRPAGRDVRRTGDVVRGRGDEVHRGQPEADRLLGDRRDLTEHRATRQGDRPTREQAAVRADVRQGRRIVSL
jgi:glycine betaine/proline transport system substrate-binding protein